MASLDVRELTEQPVATLANTPPTPRQRRLAYVVVAGLVAAFGVTVALPDFDLTPLDDVKLTLDTLMFATNVLTAILLFGLYAIIGADAVLVLASGYLFAALIIIPHAITLPGVFLTGGLVRTHNQGHAWLYMFWHLGFIAAVILYASLNDGSRRERLRARSARLSIAWSAAAVCAVAGALTWAVTANESALPRLLANDADVFLNDTNLAPLWHYVAGLNFLLSLFALVFLWLRRGSLLDQWLMVAVSAIGLELAATFFTISPFSVIDNCSRALVAVGSGAVLVTLLSEMMALYGQVARSNTLLQRERRSKLTNMEAMAASIAHEVRQPLAAIAINGSAARRILCGDAPDLADARVALDGIVRDSHRAAEIFEGVLSLFRQTDQQMRAVDLNEVVVGVLQALHHDMKDHSIQTRIDLATALPSVVGNHVQLQEVMMNLLHNAIEAMSAVTGRERVLRVRTEHHGPEEIAVSVEDSGPGIDPDKVDLVFDAFITSKPRGLGLGLAISRMIIERHHGKLSLTSNTKSGARFQVLLPITV